MESTVRFMSTHPLHFMFILLLRMIPISVFPVYFRLSFLSCLAPHPGVQHVFCCSLCEHYQSPATLSMQCMPRSLRSFTHRPSLQVKQAERKEAQSLAKRQRVDTQSTHSAQVIRATRIPLSVKTCHFIHGAPTIAPPPSTLQSARHCFTSQRTGTASANRCKNTAHSDPHLSARSHE